MNGNLRTRIMGVALLSCIATVPLYAQGLPDKTDKRDKAARRERNENRLGKPSPEAPAPGIGYVSSEFRFGGKVVKNAPYAAEAVTESTQVLANGTRLSQKNVALVYRDGEGRTRREQSGAPVGPFAPSGVTPQVIFISDPVAGLAFTLYPENRTAYRAVLPAAEIIDAANPRTTPPPPPVAGERQPRPPRPNEPGQIISLGKRVIEGLPSDGERITLTLPVNSIGNDQPIEIVEERWKSPDLRTTLWSKTSDPRWGETVYQLTNIKRGEPERTLFTVPSDYVIQEAKAQDARGTGRKGNERRPPPIRQ